LPNLISKLIFMNKINLLQIQLCKMLESLLWWTLQKCQLNTSLSSIMISHLKNWFLRLMLKNLLSLVHRKNILHKILRSHMDNLYITHKNFLKMLHKYICWIQCSKMQILIVQTTLLNNILIINNQIIQFSIRIIKINLFKCKFQSKINNKFLNHKIIHKTNKMKMLIRNYNDKIRRQEGKDI
jgi:hypothetical protein